MKRQLDTTQKLYTLCMLVQDVPGVLSQVARLFSRKGYNIESLAVGPTDDPTISRITIIVDSGNSVVEQVEKQLNKLVEVIKVRRLDAKLFHGSFKQCGLGFLAGQTVREFGAVICLDALYGIGKLLRHMPDELCRCVGAVFLEGFQVAVSAVLVNECVLIKFLPFCLSDKTGSRNKFDINLTSLPWILHLLVRFYLLFGIGTLGGLAVDPA